MLEVLGGTFGEKYSREEKCWRKALERTVGGVCWRRDMERGVVEKCWRRESREVF